MTVARDERTLITGSQSGVVSVWRLGEGTPPVLGGQGRVGASPIVATTPCRSGTSIVVCDGGLHWMDSTTGRFTLRLPHRDGTRLPFSALASGGGVHNVGHHNNVVAGTRGGSLACLDVRQRHSARVVAFWSLAPQAQRTHVGDRGAITSIVRGEHWVAASSSSGFVTMVDVRTGGVLHRWQGHGVSGGKTEQPEWSSGTEIVHMLRAGETSVVTAASDGIVLVWDLKRSLPKLKSKQGELKEELVQFLKRNTNWMVRSMPSK